MREREAGADRMTWRVGRETDDKYCRVELRALPWRAEVPLVSHSVKSMAGSFAVFSL